jgi:hypothetical protein
MRPLHPHVMHKDFRSNSELPELRQSYVFDIRTIRRGAIDDRAMRFGIVGAGSVVACKPNDSSQPLSSAPS